MGMSTRCTHTVHTKKMWHVACAFEKHARIREMQAEVELRVICHVLCGNPLQLHAHFLGLKSSSSVVKYQFVIPATIVPTAGIFQPKIWLPLPGGSHLGIVGFETF